jgi:hypothetical protein
VPPDIGDAGTMAAKGIFDEIPLYGFVNRG